MEITEHELEKFVGEEARSYLEEKLTTEKEVGTLVEKLVVTASKHHIKELKEQLDVFVGHESRMEKDGTLDGLKTAALIAMGVSRDKLLDLEFRVAVVNLRNKEGDTALLGAVKNEEKTKHLASTVKLLMEYKASAACLDDEGRSPTLLAARSTHQESAKVLKSLYSTPGGEVFVDDHDGLGRTALMLAAQVPDAALALEKAQLAVHHFPHKSAAECLTVRCVHGYQAIHYGCVGGHVEVVRYMCKKLKEFSADVNTQNFSGVRPIHLAAQFGHVCICEELRDAKADLGVKDRTGHNIRDYMQAGARDKTGTDQEQAEVAAFCDADKNNIKASGTSLPEPPSPSLTGRTNVGPRVMSAKGNANLSVALVKAKRNFINKAAVEKAKEAVLAKEKKAVDGRVWQCRTCNFQNTPSRTTCACCSAEKAPEGKRMSAHHGLIDGIESLDGRMVRIPLQNQTTLMFKVELHKEKKEVHGKEVLHVYCNGELETRISKLVLNWGTGHVKDIGVELGADDHLTEGEFTMLIDNRDYNLYELYKLASSVQGVKVVTHGDSTKNTYYQEGEKRVSNVHVAARHIEEVAPSRPVYY